MKSSRTLVRDACRADLPSIIAIEQAVFPGDRMSWRAFRRQVNSGNVFRVAEIGGDVAGYALLLVRRNSPRRRLYSIAVSPDYRGRGVGAALMDDIELHARTEEGQIVNLEVREDNGRAIALYHARGYIQTGTVEGYYDDGATALRFEKRIGPPRRATAGPGRR